MAIDIKISSDKTIEHEGKQYKPVAIRKPKEGEMLLDSTGCIHIADRDFVAIICVILQEVIPPYRTPTDEDAKQRPMAEFWGSGQSPDDSKEGMLLGVLDYEPWPFIGVINGRVSVWKHCRIPNEGAAK